MVRTERYYSKIGIKRNQFQKLFATLAVVSSIEAGSILGSGDIKRKITGDWVSQFYSRSRRADVDGAKGFRPLAAMKLYMSGSGQNHVDPATADEFETELDALTDKYTNYGCYCWINGVEGGVLGGGKTKDVTDHHCKELYRCYKCVSVDYAKNYTDVAYTVHYLTMTHTMSLIGPMTHMNMFRLILPKKMDRERWTAATTANKTPKTFANATNDSLKISQQPKKRATTATTLIPNGEITALPTNSKQQTAAATSSHKINATNSSTATTKKTAADSILTDIHTTSTKMTVVGFKVQLVIFSRFNKKESAKAPAVTL